MLKELQKVSAGKLWVTSHTVMRHKLEEDLSTLAFTLHLFRESDQHTFLEHVWKNNIPNVDKALLKDFVRKFLQLRMQSLRDKEKNSLEYHYIL
jgi:hypothetical protein